MVHARFVLDQKSWTLAPARSMLRAMCASARALGALGDLRALHAAAVSHAHIPGMTVLRDGEMVLIAAPGRYVVALSELDYWAGASLIDADGCTIASVMP
jgi:hypothetical protein